jgi:hypothetical protein
MWIIDNGADELATTEVIVLVHADLHFEVVKTRLDRFLGEPRCFFTGVTVT